MVAGTTDSGTAIGGIAAGTTGAEATEGAGATDTGLNGLVGFLLVPADSLKAQQKIVKIMNFIMVLNICIPLYLYLGAITTHYDP
jgi:hypothetical protein